MFSLRNFLLEGFKNAIGNMADYQVILNATAYYEKGILQEEDLAELQILIDEKNTPVEEPVETIPDEVIGEEPVETIPEVTEEIIDTTEEVSERVVE